MLYHYLKTRFRPAFRSREHLLAWQDEQVQRHLRRILPLSPFYRQQFRDHSIAEWQTAPLIDKTSMMAHFDRLNTVGMKKDEAFAVALQAEQSRDFVPTLNGMTVGLSSGTSGNRGLFIVSPHERYQWAGAILAKVWHQATFRLFGQRIAFFLRANSNLYRTIRSRTIQFAYFDLLDSLEEHLTRLNAFQPTVLVAPPSMLRLLAEAMIKAEARMKEKLDITPQQLISVAEVLDPLDEAIIRDSFGQQVHQIYQCTEGFLASTCRYGRLHLAEDLVAIQKEYLDADLRKFVPIITDFHRTSQPIIRYRLDDILTERASPCPCGSLFTALEQIEGRCDDLFYLRATSHPTQWVPLFPDFIRRAIITSSPQINAYIARQMQPDMIEIALNITQKNESGTQQAITTAIETLCRRLGCEMPRIRYVEIGEQVRGKKLKRVERVWEEKGVTGG